MPILRIQEQDGKWVEIPTIIGPRGPKGEKGDKGDKGDAGPQGPQGYTPIKGVDYTDGASLSHEWAGSTLKITSSSGTSSSVDLTGPQGSQGPTGPQGPQGPKGDTGGQGTQGDIGYYIKAVVPRDNFPTSDWDTYGTIGHEEGWYMTSNNGFRVGDLFIVSGTATDTGKGHMLLYSYTEKYTDAGSNTLSGLKGKCIGHAIIAAKGEKGDKGDTGSVGPQGTSVTIVGSEENSLGGGYSSVTFSVGDETVTLSARNGLDGAGAKQGDGVGAEILNDGSNEATGDFSLATGLGTKALGHYSYTEGMYSEASGISSHAEGYTTLASGHHSHAEGHLSEASGMISHAEGGETMASGYISHAEGYQTKASGMSSHSEGDNTIADGNSAHAEGNRNAANGDYSHAEGHSSEAEGESSHAEGISTLAYGKAAHAEGLNTRAKGHYSHAEGNYTMAFGEMSHAEGKSASYSTRISYKTSQLCWIGKNDVPENLTKARGLYFNNNFYIITKIEQTSEGYNLYIEESFRETGFTSAHAEVFVGGAFGEYSHVEGYGSQSAGTSSHAEGYQTRAEGHYSHAEGYVTKANGENSHAEGTDCIAGAKSSHAEGEGTQAYSEASHVEGYRTQAKTSVNHKGAHAEGYETVAVFSGSHAEGVGSYAYGKGSHAEGVCTFAYGYSSHAEGGIDEQTDKFKFSIIANGTTGTLFTHQELQPGKVVIDKTTTPPRLVEIVSLEGLEDGEFSYLVVSPFGNKSIQSVDETEGALSHCGYGSFSHAEGHGTNSLGDSSHAEGYATIAVGSYSHAEGLGTKATAAYQHVQGTYNLESNHIHIVGGGTAYARANAHTVSESGTGWFASNVTSSGSDYAEYFEWFDGNPNNEDRVGTIVALNCDKIYPANAEDDILGIVSGTATVIGDNPECDWHGRFLVDNYGRKIMEEIKETKPIYNPETGQTEEVITTRQFPKINPEYDETKTYIRRSDRPEWDIVGLMGKLHVNDDGTCVPNGYAKCGGNGIATASAEKTNMRVMKRITDNIILVFMK